ncbi:hypothetical protein BDN70DRAFT_938135 [Pholiota conissans]|uniref:Uncharacterized protein n=1 Tax=Pholiota conissans TaxID=109636 RepID=A0A9P5YRV0_9AGAR|nr:hypothetical protein BDN70DRAFT_938135 [Pholiota conissans]
MPTDENITLRKRASLVQISPLQLKKSRMSNDGALATSPGPLINSPGLAPSPQKLHSRNSSPSNSPTWTIVHNKKRRNKMPTTPSSIATPSKTGRQPEAASPLSDLSQSGPPSPIDGDIEIDLGNHVPTASTDAEPSGVSARGSGPPTPTPQNACAPPPRDAEALAQPPTAPALNAPTAHPPENREATGQPSTHPTAGGATATQGTDMPTHQKSPAPSTTTMDMQATVNATSATRANAPSEQTSLQAVKDNAHTWLRSLTVSGPLHPDHAFPPIPNNNWRLDASPAPSSFYGKGKTVDRGLSDASKVPTPPIEANTIWPSRAGPATIRFTAGIPPSHNFAP